MIFDLKQVGNFPIGFLRQITTYLYIDSFITPHSHKVNFLIRIFTDINIIALSSKLEVYNIFQHGCYRFRIEAHYAVLKGSIREVKFLLCFQYRFSLHIVPLTAIDHKSLFQPFQIIVNRFHRKGTPLIFYKFHNGIRRKGLTDIFHNIFHHPIKQIKVRDVVPFCDVAGNHRMIDSLYNLIRRTFIKISERNNGKSSHTNVFIQKLFRRAVTIFFEF